MSRRLLLIICAATAALFFLSSCAAEDVPQPDENTPSPAESAEPAETSPPPEEDGENGEPEIKKVKDLWQIRTLVTEAMEEAGLYMLISTASMDTISNRVEIGITRANEDIPAIREEFDAFFIPYLIERGYEIDAEKIYFKGGGPTVIIPVGGEEEPPRALPALELSNITRTGLRYRFVNDTDSEFTYGERYLLYVRDGDVWRQLNYNEMVPDIGYGIQPKSRTEEKRFYTWRVGELPDGEYMFRKDISIREHDEREEYYADALFTLPDDITDSPVHDEELVRIEVTDVSASGLTFTLINEHEFFDVMYSDEYILVFNGGYYSNRDEENYVYGEYDYSLGVKSRTDAVIINWEDAIGELTAGDYTFGIDVMYREPPDSELLPIVFSQRRLEFKFSIEE